jgi:ribosomal protein S6
VKDLFVKIRTRFFVSLRMTVYFMKSYKLVLLLRSDLKKDAKEKIFADIKTWLGDVNNDKLDSLGEKKLAYQIKHSKSGEFVVFNFESDKVGTDLNNRLVIRDGVLRHLLIRN